jgi:hypothetical protein
MGLLLVLAGCRRSDQAAPYASRIGVAVKLSDRVCLAIENPKLLPSATITLVKPAGLSPEGASTARALVRTRDAEACPGTRTDGELSHYDLEITSGQVEPDIPMIALDARVPSVYAAHSFHSCASADGIYLTAWDGAKPLEGQRLWTQYYSLRHAMETNCLAAETAPQ